MVRLSGAALKWIAIITMLIDHIGAVFFPQQYAYRIIGRLSFPIFAYLLVEGVIHTSDFNRYIKRLFLFAIISEIPFNLAFSGKLIDFSGFNIMFTLLIGAYAVHLVSVYGYGTELGLKLGLILLFAQVVNVDGGMCGVLAIVVFYCYRGQFSRILLWMIVIYCFMLGWIYRYAVLAMIPLCLYSGDRGKQNKWISYWFYPVHLIVLWIIKRYIV